MEASALRRRLSVANNIRLLAPINPHVDGSGTAEEAGGIANLYSWPAIYGKLVKEIKPNLLDIPTGESKRVSGVTPNG